MRGAVFFLLFEDGKVLGFGERLRVAALSHITLNPKPQTLSPKP